MDSQDEAQEAPQERPTSGPGSGRGSNNKGKKWGVQAGEEAKERAEEAELAIRAGAITESLEAMRFINEHPGVVKGESGVVAAYRARLKAKPSEWAGELTQLEVARAMKGAAKVAEPEVVDLGLEKAVELARRLLEEYAREEG